MEDLIGISAVRQNALKSIEDKERLPPLEDPDCITDIVTAIEDISVQRVLSPPRNTIEELEACYTNLPAEAKPHYVTDKMLIQRINAARRQFNDWMGKRKRMAEIPSPVESGRANYPVRKAQKRSRWEHEARGELEEKINQVKSTARGAQQRALNEIGSSVAEQTEKRREQQRNDLREQLTEGAIVQFRNPELQAGRVVRVNQKSVRVQYPNPRAGALCPITGEEQPEELEDRVQLDSEYLELLEADTIEEGEKLLKEREQH